MTIYLALDPTGRDGNPYPDGRIVARNRVEADLRSALTALGRDETDFTAANQRIATVDETDDAVWDVDCVPGWYFVGGACVASLPVIDADEYNRLVADAQAVFRIVEEEGVSKVLDRERIAPRQVGGHSWLDDIASHWRGELDGVRILSPKTVEFMTANHLPSTVTGAGSGESPLSGAETRGFGFGLGFGVNTNPVGSGIIGSLGEYSWGGAAGTVFWVDPVEEMVVVGMIQLMGSPWPLRQELRVLANQAITESLSS